RLRQSPSKREGPNRVLEVLENVGEEKSVERRALSFERLERLERFADPNPVEAAAGDLRGVRIVLDSRHASRESSSLPGRAGRAGPATDVAQVSRVVRKKVDELGTAVIGGLLEDKNTKTGLARTRRCIREHSVHIVRQTLSGARPDRAWIEQNGRGWLGHHIVSTGRKVPVLQLA